MTLRFSIAPAHAAPPELHPRTRWHRILTALYEQGPLGYPPLAEAVALPEKSRKANSRLTGGACKALLGFGWISGRTGGVLRITPEGEAALLACDAKGIERKAAA